MWGGVAIFYPLIAAVAAFLWIAIMAIALNILDQSLMYDREYLMMAVYATTWIVVIISMLIARRISEYEFIWWRR
jgi:hypothetical protein